MKTEKIKVLVSFTVGLTSIKGRKVAFVDSPPYVVLQPVENPPKVKKLKTQR
jgi:hypothetical protein